MEEEINLNVLGEILRAYNINDYHCPLSYESLDKIITKNLEVIDENKSIFEDLILVKHNRNFINSFEIFYEHAVKSGDEKFQIYVDYLKLKKKLVNILKGKF